MSFAKRKIAIAGLLMATLLCGLVLGRHQTQVAEPPKGKQKNSKGAEEMPTGFHLMLLGGWQGAETNRPLATLPITVGKPFAQNRSYPKIRGTITVKGKEFYAQVHGDLNGTAGAFRGTIREDKPFMPQGVVFGSAIQPFYFVLTKAPGKYLQKKSD